MQKCVAYLLDAFRRGSALLACRSRLLLAPRSSSSSVPIEATAALGLPVEVGARAASHGGRDGIPRGPEDGRGRGRRR
jgi:hypothetical protein